MVCQKKGSVSPKRLPLPCWIFLKLNTCLFSPRTKKHGKTKTKKTQIELGAVCSANYVFFAQKEYGIVFVLDQREKHIFSWGRQKMAKHAFVFLFCRRTPTNMFLNLVVKLFQSTQFSKVRIKLLFPWVQGLHFGQKNSVKCQEANWTWTMDPCFKRENSLRFC